MAETTPCPSCGWQNSPASRHCGGCGRALTTVPRPDAAASAGDALSAAPIPPALPTAGPALSGDTVPGGIAYSGVPVWPAAAQRPAQPVPTPPARQGPGCLVRGLMGVGLTLAILATLCAVVWVMLLRPYVHSRVDGAIADALSQAIATLPAITTADLQAAGTTVSVSATDASAVVGQMAAATGLNGVSIRFQPGVIVLTYAASGHQSTVQTGLAVRNGQLVAINTQVSGLLWWVETGDELRATLNQTLAQLVPKTPHGFQSVGITSSQLTVTLASG